MVNWSKIVVEPARVLLERTISFIPKLIVIIILITAGWITAKILEKIVNRLLKLSQLDKISEKTGIAQFLRRGEIKYTLSEVIGILVYWLIILSVIMAAANMLNLEVAAVLLNQFILFVPKVITSIFVLVLGIFFAKLLDTIIRSTAINAGMEEGRLLGKVTQVIVIVFSVITALYQLDIAKGILASIFTVILAALGLALALAFGLGCKDMAAKGLSEWLERLKKKD